MELERDAERAHAAGHLVTAHAKWLRASNYWRCAGFFYSSVDDEEGRLATAGRRRAFQAAARVSTTPVTPVEVPYENGTTLPGYLCRPAAVTRPVPAVITMGGGDAVAEEVYFEVARPLTERGFIVLCIDGPGQGEARRRGIGARYDWEVPAKAIVDYLQALPEVDPERIGIAAGSLGGYYAARSAAYEDRITACVLYGGVDHMPLATVNDAASVARVQSLVARIQSLGGFASFEAAEDFMRNFSTSKAAERIQCPIYISGSDAELAFLLPAGTDFDPDDMFEDLIGKIYTAVPHQNKTLVRHRIGTPGVEHCSLDCRTRLAEDIGDWLEDTFATGTHRNS